MIAELKKVSSPYGFSMLGVEATEKLERVSRQAQEIVRAQGFERIMPAMVDYPETFSEASSSEIFNLKDNSGERLALRTDITAQVIKGFVRQIEARSDAKLRKFYYAAPVYKDVRKNYPLPREIYQIGCEVIGERADAHLRNLVELSNLILAKALGLSGMTQVSHVGARTVFVEAFGAEYVKAELSRNAPALADLLAHRLKVDATSARRLARWLFYPGNAEKIDFSPLPSDFTAALQSSRASAQEFIGDATFAYWQPLASPRSSYYSGLFFETYVEGVTEPIARGGVYNDLIKRYADIEAGACGFALDFVLN